MMLSVPDGALIEVLASPEEVGAEICLLRGTLPPRVTVPLHSHPALEVFYVLDSTAESFQSKDGKSGWTTLGSGAVVAVPGNVKHAWRNTSPLPATVVLVTTRYGYWMASPQENAAIGISL